MMLTANKFSERLSTLHSLVQNHLVMTNPNQITFPARKTAWAGLLLITLVALAIVLVPVWIIQPFKPQSARGLEVSYALRRWSPLVTLIALVVSVLLAMRLWHGSRLWRKAVLVILFVPLVAAVWFSRQNHFEWMFNPLAHAAYAKTSEAAFVADTDIVMAVENNGEAAAYPVRLMAYHHLVQDVVGGTPIVATY
jgi:Protein of unknown function (DUF3179)